MRGKRIGAIDGLRGAAICLMIVYHFAFDLNQPWVRVLYTDINNSPYWLGFRALIVSMFLLTVGISLRLAHEARISALRFWTRLARIAVCAVLVSLGSYLVFPRTFIGFGILHCIAVSSLLAWPLAGKERLALGLGICAIVVGNLVRLPLFDAPALHWIGMMTHKPATEDYVPLLPWIGVVLVGIAVGAQLRSSLRFAVLERAAPGSLRWLGRHSLPIYMLHQPVLLGGLWLVFGR